MDKVQYGTLSEPLVVESEVAQDVAELKSEVRTGKWMVLFGLAIACVFCVATFAMVCVATEYSKEVTIINSALIDKKTNNVVSTREHEEIIQDPIKNGSGVKWLTFYSADGGITRAEVSGFEQVTCTEATKEKYCVDGEHYFFKTILGSYAATPVINKDFEASVKFAPVDDEFVMAAKAEATKSDKHAFATGYHNTRISQMAN
mmetsp:Transcript_28663/g.34820  ORF Transcript_28663/g.34820 Transcript_28663/m.34820 type:complete len:203 (+) Transcript_28663:74-682(+)|eukprot:CAMPEP_0197865232 /NCGR_PEP_ID=MMETSP1438-20131217/43545_1 /TAXON_ID=1461541 /ORGANISM="Pterosperma sp., Strain CCMP1384" /LENGTH=202 /DNA_ID=CAMNT_0043483665 /DNA_START=1290 /DNA_END=1898 /DNA_ORIENTATION=-